MIVFLKSLNFKALNVDPYIFVKQLDKDIILMMSILMIFYLWLINKTSWIGSRKHCKKNIMSRN